MNRFANTPPTKPEDEQGKGTAYQDRHTLLEERAEFDNTIIDWAAKIKEPWLSSDFTWSNIAGTRTSSQPAWRLVTHFLNHQTHHRGQAHALLTAFNATPEDTDLFLMP